MPKLIPLAAMVVVALVAFTGGSSPPASAGIFLPPGGTDEFEINGQVTIDLGPLFGPTEKVFLTGNMTVVRSDPNPKTNTVDIEIIALQLTGDSSLLGPGTPVKIGLNPNAPPSTGQIGPITGFPSEGFFDVLFADLKIGTFQHFLQNLVNMFATINGIPFFRAKFDSGPIVNPIQDNLEPTRTVGFVNNLHIDIKPPEKPYTITVLKRNGDTKQGLPGWEINLYDGPDCLGLPHPDSGLTDADGLIEFGGLAPGIYSVQETLQPGWNAEGPVCKEAAVGPLGPLAHESPAPLGVVPTCPISPNLPFPDPGCDEFSSIATVKVELTNPPAGEFGCDLSGPTVITRSAVETKPPDSIDTEIVAMQLEGSCQPGNIPVKVRVSGSQASTGRIIEQNDSIPGTLEFPADSFFDVFFEIDTPIGTLHNNDPLRLLCKISAIPPFGCFYEPDVGVVQLFDDTEKKAGSCWSSSPTCPSSSPTRMAMVAPTRRSWAWMRTSAATATLTISGTSSTPTGTALSASSTS